MFRLPGEEGRNDDSEDAYSYLDVRFSVFHSFLELGRGESEGIRRLLGGHHPRVPSLRTACLLRRFVQHSAAFTRECVRGVGIAGNRRNGAAKAAGTFLCGETSRGGESA